MVENATHMKRFFSHTIVVLGLAVTSWLLIRYIAHDPVYYAQYKFVEKSLFMVNMFTTKS